MLTIASYTVHYKYTCIYIYMYIYINMVYIYIYMHIAVRYIAAPGRLREASVARWSQPLIWPLRSRRQSSGQDRTGYAAVPYLNQPEPTLCRSRSVKPYIELMNSGFRLVKVYYCQKRSRNRLPK